MPIYEYKCPHCETRYQEIKKIEDRLDSPVCCNEKTKQVITAPPMVNESFLGSTKNPGYISPLSEKWISTKKQRNDEMKEFNVVPKE